MVFVFVFAPFVDRLCKVFLHLWRYLLAFWLCFSMLITGSSPTPRGDEERAFLLVAYILCAAVRREGASEKL